MASLDDLSVHTQNNDTKNFLLTYLQIIDEGQNLPVPTSLELPGIIEGWNEILPSVTGGYTDEFVEALSQYWLSIVKKQGGTVTETFTKELIGLIEGKPFKAPTGPSTKLQERPPMQQGPKMPNAPKAQETTPTEEEPPQPTSTPADATTEYSEGISTKISSSYYSYQEAKDTDPIGEKEIPFKINLALNKNDADDFLIAYLSNIKHNKDIKVPITSVIDTIKERWEELLMGEFNHQPSKEFIKALSSKWFYLVNQKGLPTNKEKLEEYLYYLLANKKPSIQLETAPPKSGGFLNKFKSIFRK